MRWLWQTVRRVSSMILLTLAVSAAQAESPTVLKFQQIGSNLTITATRQDDSEQYWQLVVDETRGVITHFYDLTSEAGTDFDFASPYAWGCGLFAPWSTAIRSLNDPWDYTPGTKVNGQSSYTYTISHDFSYGTRETAVTINVPTAEGTWLNGVTTSTYTLTADLAQTASPAMHLNAASEAEMNTLYTGAVQDSLAVDGTLWTQVAVNDNGTVTGMGLAPGRTFRLTALNLTNGTGILDLDNASALVWHSAYRAQNSVTGGIYNNAQCKPPAGTVVYTYVRLDINITGTGVIPNELPVAEAGSNQTVIDLNDSGGEVVHLDGLASHDPDGPLVSYIWTRGGEVILDEEAGDVTLPVGQHMITLTVTDIAGATDSDDVFITVEERTPLVLYVDQNHENAGDGNVGTDPEHPLATISAAASAALPGDTVVVAEGTYRETVNLSTSGTADKPITLRSKTGDRVVVAASDELTGWQQLTEELAQGNPYYTNIYYVDLAWQPSRIEEDRARLGIAREPDIGWWLVGEGSTGTQIVDPDHLVETDPTYYVGATLYFRDMQPVITRDRTITAYDPATHTVTLDATVSWFNGDDPPVEYPPVPGIDRYYLHNKLNLLDQPGEYVLEDRGGLWRLYVWPTDSGAPGDHLYEGSRRGEGIRVLGANYITLDGLEVIHTGGLGHAIQCSGCQDVTVEDCVVHANEYMGIAISNCERAIVRNNLSFENGYGITVGTSTDVAVYENDVHHNTVDGIVVAGRQVDGVIVDWSTNIYIERNYVHDHVLYGHPDNLQFHSGVINIWYQDNVIVNSGQSCMMEGADGVHFVNNIISTSMGGMLHTGDPDNLEVRGNTLALSGFGCLTVRETGMVGIAVFNNIFYQGHPRPLYGAYDTNEYTGDYNLVCLGTGIPGDQALGWNGTTGWTTVEQFSIWSGQDANSFYADPLFANAPAYWIQLHANSIPSFTTSEVRVNRDADLLQVGDHIELECDGVVRQITAKDENWITFDPPLETPLELAGCIANWKGNTNYTLDFTPLPASPAYGNGEGGSDIGSSLNMSQYRAGDFTGDGIRDVPLWPPQQAPADLVLAVEADHDWVYQNTQTATGDRHRILLTVRIAEGGVPGETYEVTELREDDNEVTDFVVPDLPIPLPADEAGAELVIQGGRKGVAAPNTPVTPSYTFTVVAQGSIYGQTGSASLPLVLRPLGDVDGSLNVNIDDEGQINNQLNGLAVQEGIELRDLDLTGDGVNVNIDDQAIINSVLNGVLIP